ncbi:hypothetical protein EBU99_09650 [bacterium]|nr:hypothetical protein [bacterium]
METPRKGVDLSDYNVVLSAFVELRGRGLAVSAHDLEVLKNWADDGLPPQLLVDALETICLEYQRQDRRFRGSLKALDRQVRRAIREKQEY